MRSRSARHRYSRGRRRRAFVVDNNRTRQWPGGGSINPHPAIRHLFGQFCDCLSPQEVFVGTQIGDCLDAERLCQQLRLGVADAL